MLIWNYFFSLLLNLLSRLGKWNDLKCAYFMISVSAFWMGIFLDFLMYFIQHCFICRPSDFTVSEDAGSNPGLLRLRHWQPDALTTRRSHPQSARSHPHSARSHPHSARSHPHSARYHPHSAGSHPHSARSRPIWMLFLFLASISRHTIGV